MWVWCAAENRLTHMGLMVNSGWRHQSVCGSLNMVLPWWCSEWPVVMSNEELKLCVYSRVFSLSFCHHLSMLCRPKWAREHCRISPPHLLAECHKRWLNQSSFVLLCFVSLLLWVVLVVYCFVCQYQSSDWLWRPPLKLRRLCRLWC